jgi:hypothetical protein
VVEGSRGGSDHQRILEPGPRNAEQTLTQLIAVLDYQDLARAIERLEKGSGVMDLKDEHAIARPVSVKSKFLFSERRIESPAFRLTIYLVQISNLRLSKAGRAPSWMIL